MKDFSEYKSAEEFVQDLVAEGVFRRTKKSQDMFPGVAPAPRANWVAKLKQDVFQEVMTSNTVSGPISAYNLNRKVRGDNHKDEYKIAIRELIEEKKIIEQRLETGKRGRPSILYHLFEF